MSKTGISNVPSRSVIHRAPQRSSHVLQNGILLIALGLFAGAAALAVVRPPEAPAIYQAHTTLDLPDPFPQADSRFSQPFISETHIRRGDTLAALLRRLNVDAPGLLHFLASDKNAKAIYKLYPGRSLQAAKDQDGNLMWLRYNHTPFSRDGGEPAAKWLEVRPEAEGGYVAEEKRAASDAQVRIAEAEIKSSLFAATDDADIPDAVTLQMAEILGSKIDFLQDLRKGDRFRVIYESMSHDGVPTGAGRILALEFEAQNESYQAVWFESEDGGGYYDFDGASLRGAFLRTALKFSRISSTFGGRRHPIHGNWRQHKGVDFAAPTGTPIHATADGVVQSMGWKNGYGRTIVLKHHGKYSTLYAHQSRFAQSLKPGDRVAQGQLIGYVGSTGWATGPHLHYELLVDGKQIDPMAVDVPIARKLEGIERRAFDKVVAQYRDHIDLLASYGRAETKIAQR